MKKILLLALVSISVCITTSAQSLFKQTATNSTGAILNTSVDTLSLTVTQPYSMVAIQPVVTKTSGTMAGTAALYASLDGVNFVATGDSFTLTNVTTNTTLWTKSAAPWKYFRILVGGATTVAGTAKAYITVVR